MQTNLMINPWVTDNQKTWFSESSLDLIGKCTRCKTASYRCCSSVGSILKDSTLSIGTSRDNTDVRWILNGYNDTCSQEKFFVSLFQVYEMDT